jgi:hypothetical protein
MVIVLPAGSRLMSSWPTHFPMDVQQWSVGQVAINLCRVFVMQEKNNLPVSGATWTG